MTGTVQLRDVAESDLPILFEQQSDPEANRMAAVPARDRDAFAAHWTKILADASITIQTILFDGQVAGHVLCFERGGKIQVGYWLGKDYWGKGIATRALAAFLPHVKTRPLYAFAAKHNVGSLRVLEKCGFAICGEAKNIYNAPGEEIEDFVLRLDADERDEAT